MLNNNNSNLYNLIVSEAQKDAEIIQSFKTLSSNLKTPNYHYDKPKELENLNQSRIYSSVIEGPNINPISGEPQQRPLTPRPSTPLKMN